MAYLVHYFGLIYSFIDISKVYHVYHTFASTEKSRGGNPSRLLLLFHIVQNHHSLARGQRYTLRTIGIKAHRQQANQQNQDQNCRYQSFHGSVSFAHHLILTLLIITFCNFLSIVNFYISQNPRNTRLIPIFLEFHPLFCAKNNNKSVTISVSH